MPPCALSCSTRRDSPGSRTCRRPASRCACSLRASAARTSRRSGSAPAGTVLGHEVVAESRDGARVALVHHLPCGECERCRAGHESTCERVRGGDDRPRRLRRRGGGDGGRSASECDRRRDGHVRRAARVRAARRRARAARACAHRRPRLRRPPLRRGAPPPRRRRLRYRCEPRTQPDALPTARSTPPCSARPPLRSRPSLPGGTVLVFSDAATVDLDEVYRRELTLTGSRSATPRHMHDAAALLSELDVPEPIVLPLERFHEGLELYRSGARAEGRLHAVRALRFHGTGDLRLEEVPRPEPGPGDVLVQVEVALTDGTDLKAFRRGHPVLLGELPSPFGHEFCGIDVATGQRVVAANSAAGDERGEPLELLNGAYAEYLLVPARDRAGQPPARPDGARARGGGDGRAARVLPARRRAGGDPAGRPRRDHRRRPDRPDAVRLRRRRRRRTPRSSAAGRSGARSCRSSAARRARARAPTS